MCPLFVGGLNGHHQDWLVSTSMNRHGVAAFDLATVSGCDQLVDGTTHARGGTLDHPMTDVPDLLRWLLLYVIYPKRSSMHTIRISRGLLINEGMLIFKQEAPHRRTCDHLWFKGEKFLHHLVRATNLTDAKHKFSVRNRGVLMIAQSPHN